MIFFCVGVMYSDEYHVCDVTLSVYPHRTSLKDMPGHGGQAYFLSLSGVARHIFQACPVWIYTQSNITNMVKLSFDDNCNDFKIARVSARIQVIVSSSLCSVTGL
jgi:hypothetical protein